VADGKPLAWAKKIVWDMAMPAGWELPGIFRQPGALGNDRNCQ